MSGSRKGCSTVSEGKGKACRGRGFANRTELQANETKRDSLGEKWANARNRHSTQEDVQRVSKDTK